LWTERSLLVLPSFGSGAWPAIRLATIFFWFGMITVKTLATMMVPISAPIWLKAPRPLSTWVKA